MVIETTGKTMGKKYWLWAQDVLPDYHELATKDVYCQDCGEMVHAWNNEDMKNWVETEDFGNHCLDCLVDFARMNG